MNVVHVGDILYFINARTQEICSCSVVELLDSGERMVLEYNSKRYLRLCSSVGKSYFTSVEELKPVKYSRDDCFSYKSGRCTEVRCFPASCPDFRLIVKSPYYRDAYDAENAALSEKDKTNVRYDKRPSAPPIKPAKAPAPTNKDRVLVDRKLKCIECSQPFVFTVGEQEYFLAHHLSAPRRCERCRKLSRKRYDDYVGRAAIADAMSRGDMAYRTGSKGRKSISVSGGEAVEITDFTVDCINSGYTEDLWIE